MPSPSITDAWVHLVRAQRRILSAIEHDLRTAELPPLAWYDILLELGRAPEGKLRPYEIENRMLLAQYNLSRLIDRLERDGLVSRMVFDDDGRGRWVTITKAGRAMQARMWKVYSAAIDLHMGSKLDDAGADRLSELLNRLAH